jgi:predicted TIM-barrel fold metal-dependent hydrolase
MTVIDAHAHLYDFKGYLEDLIRTMDENNISKCCISGLGPLFRCADNEAVRNAIKKYPDRLIGAYFIRPGTSSNKEVERAKEDGFRMIKVTIPTRPYDDPTFNTLWATIQDSALPVLFHTGVITLLKNAPGERISSWFMHPMRIEPIVNAYPDLNVIIAHLGVHWNDDAAELLRMKNNVYADLSGAPDGWRVRMDKMGLDHWLWWPNAFKKLIFGTDVHFSNIKKVIQEDKNRFEKLSINKEIQELYFSGNILKLLGEK